MCAQDVIGVASITQLRTCVIKKRNIQGRSSNVVKVIFHTTRKCVLKERIRSQREPIPTCMRSYHFGKGYYCRKALLDPVASLWCAYFSALWRRHWMFIQEYLLCTRYNIVCTRKYLVLTIYKKKVEFPFPGFVQFATHNVNRELSDRLNSEMVLKSLKTE